MQRGRKRLTGVQQLMASSAAFMASSFILTEKELRLGFETTLGQGASLSGLHPKVPPPFLFLTDLPSLQPTSPPRLHLPGTFPFTPTAWA